ncbi:MAG: endonuclease III [Oscillospiraceae bacterium]|nr:endonuclease III [Oscillospiraceae bacterium]
MRRREDMAEVIRRLEAYYPDAHCALEAGEDAFRLLVMAILSAQCTDARVNLVSGPLFARFPDAPSMAKGSVEELEELIRTCGLYHSKAKNLHLTAIRLTEVYGGEVPSEMEELLTLAGVGRKVANLIRGDVFGLGGIVADTHCIRISNLLGFVSTTDPRKVEFALDELVPKEKQSDFCHRLVQYGRDVCIARRPQCDVCVLRNLCDHGKKQEGTP